jgi:hypothetical protein
LNAPGGGETERPERTAVKDAPNIEADGQLSEAEEAELYRVEERPGRRRREPGQVRLRRYLVTEVVTETETGQRHEVRVEAEPVTQQDVPDLAATSNPEDAPARRGPPEPDPSDWFRAEDDLRR